MENAVQRRLAAILATDVVGYSRLMGEDETGTLAALKRCRTELIEPRAAQYNGRTIKLMGDGALMEFGGRPNAAAGRERVMSKQDTGGFLVVSDEVLAGLGVSQAEIMDSIEDAILAEARGALWTAPKSAVLPGDGRYLMTTLAAADDPRMTVVKSVMVSPRNPGRGLPGIEGAIMLHDSETGQVLAVMGAHWVTAVRTAGLSGVVARRLANPDARSIAFVGCGVQARSHLATFAELFPLSEIRAFGRGRANIDSLCAEARNRGLEARACTSPREALEGADLVVSSITLSFDVEPFLDARWLKPGAFAAITDLAIPWDPRSMAAFDTIVIDDRAQERSSEKKMVEESAIAADLREMLTGDAPFAFDADRRSAFVFRGIAVGDFAVASLGLARASAAGRGTFVRW